MPFNEALEYFLAFQPHQSGVPTKYQRGVFHEALLHEKHGLRINIIRISERSEYVALRPENVDLEPLLLNVFNDINDNSKISDSALELDKETLQGIVSTMDSEWDKVCLRVVLRSIYSRDEMQGLGFDPDNLPFMTERVKFVAEEVKNADEVAVDIVRLRLTSKKEILEKKISEKERLYGKKRHVWSTNTVEEILSDIQELKEKVQDVDNLLCCEPTDTCYQKKRQMLKRQASSLIESNRLKRRKLPSQGPKWRPDGDDEDFIAKAIEDKASYHGRRHDTVLYTGQRVKKKNLLTIANYRLAQHGKKLIRSATTVYNRARPRNKRSMQAKRHTGKGLFCWKKKTPKGEEKSNKNTHYQRAHVKNIKKRFWGAKNDESRKFCFMRSMDDKAYLRPGTSEGFEKARNLRILTLTDKEKERKLPKYDWPEKMVYVTPGSHRIFTKSSVMTDNDEKLVTEDHRHHVIVRPKAVVGSSESVWASETIRLRHEDPTAFKVKKTETIAEYSLGFRKCCARLHDDLFLYHDMTESDDINKITEEHNCKFYAYEKQIAGHLKLRLEKMLQLSEVTELSEHNKSLLACRVIPTIKDILKAIDEVANSDAPVDTAECRVQSIFKVSRACKQGLEIVRMSDLALAFLTMKFVVADALVDGATLEWEKYRRFEDLSEDEIKAMSLHSYEQYEKERMEKNAWYDCKQVAERIDDAPVLKDYISSRVSESSEELFFF